MNYKFKMVKAFNFYNLIFKIFYTMGIYLIKNDKIIMLGSFNIYNSK